MAIRFTCPHCGHQTDVDDNFAGKSGPCSSCGQTISIPWAGAEVAGSATASKSSAPVVALIVGVLLVGALGVIALLVALLLPAVNAARSAARRAQCINNAKQIALALDAYHQEHGNYPPAHTVDDQGRPLHSWRVLILPYLGAEAASLYSKIDLNQPWDAEVNRRYVNQMPSVYACPADSAASGMGETSYCVVEGPGYIFNADKTVGKAEIADGLSQTLMVVEVVSSGIDWMEPKDVDQIRLAQGINSGAPSCCGSNHLGGIVTVFADMSVEFLTDITPPEELHEMSTVAGGEVVSP